MNRNTKIATCCYCGTRAALTLDAGRHVLACSSCGAALSNLKSLPVDRTKPDRPTVRGPKPSVAGYGLTSAAIAGAGRKAKKKKKKAKSFFKDIFDEIEDIFD
jgi:hypothetical protein